MDNKQYNALFSFIWNIANDLPNSRKKGYLILGAHDNGGNVVGKDVGKVGGDVALIEMTDIQKNIIDLVESDASISIDQMAVKKRTLEREIAKMKQTGYISRTGSPRSGKWEVIIPYNCVIEIV